MDSKRIENEAADWLAKRDGSDWTSADEQAFVRWQDESTAHRIAVIRIRTAWDKAERLRALGAGVPRGEIPAPGSLRVSQFLTSKERSRPLSTWEWGLEDQPDGPSLDAPRHVPQARGPIPRTRRFYGGAAIGSGIAIAAGWLFLSGGPNTYHSAIGETKIVTLSDGSTVTLNTDTAIHVSMSAHARHVELERGEAFFEVAKDPSRAFVVGAGGERVVAVGTKFSVLREGIDARVVVTEGQVEIEDIHGGVVIAPPTKLPAGSVAQAGAAGVLLKRVSIADAETLLTWRAGYIAFHDTDLAAVVAELNRYSKKQLVIADPDIATLRVGGNLRAANVAAFVRILEEDFAVQARDEGDRVVLTRKAAPTGE